MGEIVNQDQVVSVVPQNFRNATKGKVVSVRKDAFIVETKKQPEGVLTNHMTEFYSQTKNGVLYFESNVISVDENKITIATPIKHRYLQRRQYTRIKFAQELDMKLEKKSHSITTIDLSAGGMKIRTKEPIDIDSEYSVSIKLSEEMGVDCKFTPIRIEKNDEGVYTISGRFKNLSNVDKMTLVQFCIKKKIENVNK